jgi:hypothetical protein
MVFALNPRQKEALPTLEWLLSDSQKDRGSGRTTVLAYALLKKAIRYEGRPVSIVIDLPGVTSYAMFTKGIKRVVLNLFSEFPVYDFTYNALNCTIIAMKKPTEGTCCGHLPTSNFCPHCGGRLR